MSAELEQPFDRDAEGVTRGADEPTRRERLDRTPIGADPDPGAS